MHEYTGNYVGVLPLKNVKRRCYLVRLIVLLTINQNLIMTTLPYIFMHFDVAPTPSSKYFGTCILNTFEIMYLYLCFKYFFGWVLVLVLQILFKVLYPSLLMAPYCVGGAAAATPPV